MLATNDVAKVYDTILSIPGMNEIVKMDIRISRKNVLLLTKIIERGLSAKDDGKNSILDIAPKESLDEFATLSIDFLQKAGLTELNEKLKLLNAKEI